MIVDFQSILNTVQTLVRIAPDEVLPGFITKVTLLLGNDELVMVTRDEYGAYLCEEGQLYDKHLAERLTNIYIFFLSLLSDTRHGFPLWDFLEVLQLLLSLTV